MLRIGCPHYLNKSLQLVSPRRPLISTISSKEVDKLKKKKQKRKLASKVLAQPPSSEHLEGDGQTTSSKESIENNILKKVDVDKKSEAEVEKVHVRPSVNELKEKRKNKNVPSPMFLILQGKSRDEIEKLTMKNLSTSKGIESISQTGSKITVEQSTVPEGETALNTNFLETENAQPLESNDSSNSKGIKSMKNKNKKVKKLINEVNTISEISVEQSTLSEGKTENSQPLEFNDSSDLKGKKKKKKKKATKLKNQEVNEISEISTVSGGETDLYTSLALDLNDSSDLKAKTMKEKKKKKAKNLNNETSEMIADQLGENTEKSNATQAMKGVETVVKDLPKINKKMSSLINNIEKDSPKLLESVLEMINKKQLTVQYNNKLVKIDNIKNLKKKKVDGDTKQIDQSLVNEGKKNWKKTKEIELILGSSNLRKSNTHEVKPKSKLQSLLLTEFKDMSKEKETEVVIDKEEKAVVVDSEVKVEELEPENIENNYDELKIEELNLEEEEYNKSKIKTALHEQIKEDIKSNADNRNVSKLMTNLLDGVDLTNEDAPQLLDKVFSWVSQTDTRKRSNNFNNKENVNFDLGVTTNLFSDCHSVFHYEPTLHERHWNEMLEASRSNLFQIKFEKMILNNKEWKFPIDNEQDMGTEEETHFTEHVFLDGYLSEFPDVALVRNYMELVITGLEQNPHLSVKEKHDRILWHKEYFENFSDDDFHDSIKFS